MPLQKYITTHGDKMVIVEGIKNRQYQAILGKGVTIPDEVLNGTAQKVECFVEFEHTTPVVYSFRWRKPLEQTAQTTLTGRA